LYFQNFLPFHDSFHEWNLVHGILKLSWLTWTKSSTDTWNLKLFL
jgi:hypothetical protein